MDTELAQDQSGMNTLSRLSMDALACKDDLAYALQKQGLERCSSRQISKFWLNGRRTQISLY
jgi:hypothetical protein